MKSFRRCCVAEGVRIRTRDERTVCSSISELGDAISRVDSVGDGYLDGYITPRGR